MSTEMFFHDLQFLRELLTCGHALYSWTYNSNLQPIYSNCPDEPLFHLLFSLDRHFDMYLQNLNAYDKPVIFTNSIGLMWVADFERDSVGQITCVHIIGPAFYNDVSPAILDNALSSLALSITAKRQVMNVLSQVPIIPITRLLEYGLMLHYTLTRERIDRSEFIYPKAIDPNTSRKDELNKDVDLRGTWAAEQAMLKLVEDGNLDYRNQRTLRVHTGTIGNFGDGTPIRQIKNQVIVHIALCTRAAIRGGLYPETAYILSDQYIQNAEACNTIAELAEVNRIMLDDFIYRVHQHKMEIGISPQIQKCCDYIQLHIEEKLPVAELASYVGYAENYLTKKFRQETGITISSYIMQEKIERAKALLIGSNASVQEIAASLGFLSQSYFCEQFRKKTGVTPSVYRKKN